jgi:hypothetical protein
MNPVGYVNYTNIDPNAEIFLGNLAPVFVEGVPFGGTNPITAVSGLLAASGYGNAVATTEQTIPEFVRLTQPNYAWADSDLSGVTTIHCTNIGSGNFTGGDPGNSLQIAFSYYIFDTATGEFVAS